MNRHGQLAELEDDGQLTALHVDVFQACGLAEAPRTVLISWTSVSSSTMWYFSRRNGLAHRWHG